ncbi:TMV resistance protein N-like isoform X1 [Gossypium australe]|uniref:TMV resistance protein N-like isoform X1 n=1 Tax=Gossypium australe TaxID=47621 RepID=A0A5B6VTX1_9ROSI|nr:TMV resistance protein N-like isoform X1 [Gossypium australe]
MGARDLHLSYNNICVPFSRSCNLCEGDIPTDISSLSSSAHLDLGRNNLITIPLSLNRFFQAFFSWIVKLQGA